MNNFLCITGMPGSGKSVVSDYFVSKNFQFVRFGQIVLDEVKKQNLKPNEFNERKIRENIRKKYGMGALAILNYPKFQKLLKKGNVVADGLYSWDEYKFLKKKFGRKMKVIAVFAPPALRYKRISKRVLNKKDTKFRNRPLTAKETMSRDHAQIEKLDIGGTIAMADYTIINTKDTDFLFKQVEEVFGNIKAG